MTKIFVCPISRVVFELHFINRFSACQRSSGNFYDMRIERFKFKPDFCQSAAVFNFKNPPPVGYRHYENEVKK